MSYYFSYKHLKVLRLLLCAFEIGATLVSSAYDTRHSPRRPFTLPRRWTVMAWFPPREDGPMLLQPGSSQTAKQPNSQTDSKKRCPVRPRGKTQRTWDPEDMRPRGHETQRTWDQKDMRPREHETQRTWDPEDMRTWCWGQTEGRGWRQYRNTEHQGNPSSFPLS